MGLPNHLFVSDSDGALYDTRAAQWSESKPLRAAYKGHARQIDSLAQVKAALRAGQWTDIGGYPLFFIMADNGALSFESARANYADICAAHSGPYAHDQWRVSGVAINYEDSDLVCDHSGARIPSAYGESDND